MSEVAVDDEPVRGRLAPWPIDGGVPVDALHATQGVLPAPLVAQFLTAPVPGRGFAREQDLVLTGDDTTRFVYDGHPVAVATAEHAGDAGFPVALRVLFHWVRTLGRGRQSFKRTNGDEGRSRRGASIKEALRRVVVVEVSAGRIARCSATTALRPGFRAPVKVLDEHMLRPRVVSHRTAAGLSHRGMLAEITDRQSGSRSVGCPPVTAASVERSRLRLDLLRQRPSDGRSRKIVDEHSVDVGRALGRPPFALEALKYELLAARKVLRPPAAQTALARNRIRRAAIFSLTKPGPRRSRAVIASRL
jgi:hypothetical protein